MKWKGEEFNGQIFASDPAAHRLILSWLLEVLLWSSRSKTKTGHTLGFSRRHSPAFLQALAWSDSESGLCSGIIQLHPWVGLQPTSAFTPLPLPPPPTKSCALGRLFVAMVTPRDCTFLLPWLRLRSLPHKSQFLLAHSTALSAYLLQRTCSLVPSANPRLSACWAGSGGEGVDSLQNLNTSLLPLETRASKELVEHSEKEVLGNNLLHLISKSLSHIMDHPAYSWLSQKPMQAK